MSLTPFLILAAIVIAVMLVKRAGQVSAGDARAYLNRGALVIDVRSTGEFSSGHLAKTINIPLEELETALPKRVPDKNQVMLLHCASGTRSGMARSKLRGMGYQKVFNLGSYGRAESLLNPQS